MTDMQTISIDADTVTERLRELRDVADQLAVARRALSYLPSGGPELAVVPRFTGTLESVQTSLLDTVDRVRDRVVETVVAIERTVDDLGALDREHAQIFAEFAAYFEDQATW